MTSLLLLLLSIMKTSGGKKNEAVNHTIILNDYSRGELTCVDEKLIGDSRMINVMDSSCKNGGQNFQICEDGLQSKMSSLNSMFH